MFRKAAQILSLVIVLGLVMPLCVKAFAAPQDLGANTQSASENSEKKQSLVPCLSCCGGWKAMLRKVDALRQPPSKPEMALKAELSLCVQPNAISKRFNARAPPELFQTVRNYVETYAITGRLLL